MIPMQYLTERTPWARVVIVNFNGGDMIGAVVAALARQSMEDFEAVVVDNGSTDGSIQRLTLPDGRFRIIHAGANLGFAAGCNLGCRDARTPWLAMLNPDAVPDAGWLKHLREATVNHPTATMFGSTQLCAENPHTLDGAGDNYSIFGLAWRGGYGAQASVAEADTHVFSPCAAASLYRRDVFEAVGGFADSFFCYLEDVDLGFRLRLRGQKAIQVAAARVSHAGSAISGRYSRFTLFHSARNGVFLMVRCMPLPLLLLALPLYLAAQAWLMISMRKIARPASRLGGIAAGLTQVPRLLAERRQIHRRRSIGTIQVARMLAWNPSWLLRRATLRLAWEDNATQASSRKSALVCHHGL